MDTKPFVRLAEPRVVNCPWLPPDLAEFYSQHEGVGLESSLDRSVRLCRLEEVAHIRWKDLFTTSDDIPEGWKGFTALRIGVGIFGDEILYVLNAPSCPLGSVLAIGRDLAGPGGDGPFRMESTLVLAASFPEWLTHLERWGWVEHALGAFERSSESQQEVFQYYLALNPNITRPV